MKGSACGGIRSSVVTKYPLRLIFHAAQVRLDVAVDLAPRLQNAARSASSGREGDDTLVSF